MLKYFAALLLAVSLLTGCSPRGDWAGDPQKVHQVTAGMSESEVRDILGEPTKNEKIDMGGLNMTVWEYHGPNDNINIVFDVDGVMATGLNGAEIVIPQ